MDRLGAAGVSVPGLGIGGGGGNGGHAGRSVQPPPSANGSTGGGSGMNELQSRFSKFGVGASSGQSGATSPASATVPTQGTTWAQKQAALKTMSDFKKNPSSVSLSDARSAASTANNFRQRHGEQVAAGVKTANGLEQKYGVSGRVGGYLANSSNGTGTGASAEQGGGAQSHLNTIGAAAGMLGGKKKPPPPPPKKKPGIMGGDASRDEEDRPPPVPMATRPTF